MSAAAGGIFASAEVVSISAWMLGHVSDLAVQIPRVAVGAAVQKREVKAALKADNYNRDQRADEVVGCELELRVRVWARVGAEGGGRSADPRMPRRTRGIWIGIQGMAVDAKNRVVEYHAVHVHRWIVIHVMIS